MPVHLHPSGRRPPRWRPVPPRCRPRSRRAPGRPWWRGAHVGAGGVAGQALISSALRVRNLRPGRSPRRHRHGRRDGRAAPGPRAVGAGGDVVGRRLQLGVGQDDGVVTDQGPRSRCRRTEAGVVPGDGALARRGCRRPGCRWPRRRLAARSPRRSRRPRPPPRSAACARPAAGTGPPARSRPVSGTGRPTCEPGAEAGRWFASACTSCGSARVTAPVSTGSVSTRIAASAAGISSSGRCTRSKYLETAGGVVDGDVAAGVLELLQDGVGGAGRRTCRRTASRAADHDHQCRAGDHVGGSGTGGGGAGEGGQPVSASSRRPPTRRPCPARLQGPGR